jgi:secondary thiamine-phosphate synthase enzyme
MKELKIVSKKRNEMIDITHEVQKVIDTDNIQEGIALVYVPHTTAGVTINEGADPSVKRDIIETMNDLIPDSGNYHHSEGNSDAHIKASLVGSSVMVIFKEKRLVLGTWQHIFFYEGDGPRSRRVYINLIRERISGDNQ